jgi:hypothetical protein
VNWETPKAVITILEATLTIKGLPNNVQIHGERGLLRILSNCAPELTDARGSVVPVEFIKESDLSILPRGYLVQRDRTGRKTVQIRVRPTVAFIWAQHKEFCDWVLLFCEKFARSNARHRLGADILGEVTPRTLIWNSLNPELTYGYEKLK